MMSRRTVPVALVFVMSMIAATPLTAACSTNELKANPEAQVITERLAAAYEADPEAFQTNFFGEKVRVPANVEYVRENGHVELRTGRWAWGNHLRCVFDSNSAMVDLRNGKPIVIEGTVHSVRPLALSPGNRVYLVGCRLLHNNDRTPG